MQNSTEQQKKDSVLKSLAIVGFVGLIIVISWLGIQLVQVLPNAFSSLASLADSVYNYEEVSLTVVSNKSVVGTGETFTLTWGMPKQTGTFALSYKCAEGLAIDIRDNEGIKSLNCDTNYNIGSVNTVDVIAYAERQRFTDFAYQIDFIPTKAEAPTGNGTGRVSVVNASISDDISDSATSTDEENVEEEDNNDTPVNEDKPTVTTPSKPTYTQEYTYGIPTSNPNGYTDLSARHLGSGTIVNGKFVLTNTIDNDSQGAIQFEVKNIGTKTSSAWTYTVKLPNGETYKSPTQTALKPQERSTIAIGFDIPETTGMKTHTVQVIVSSDSKPANNGFTAAVMVTE